MEGVAVPSTSGARPPTRPVKTLSSRHPLAIAAARAGRGQGHSVPGSIRRVRVKRGDTLTDVAKAHRYAMDSPAPYYVKYCSPNVPSRRFHHRTGSLFSCG